MWISEMRYRLRALLRRGAMEQELAEELEHHAATSAGSRMPEHDAVAEACREARGVGWIEDLGRDWRWAWRSLRHAPGFTLPVVLTLALGMGAAVAMFSVGDAVLLEPLAYPGAQSLVLLRERLPMIMPQPVAVSAPDIGLMRAGGRAFSAVGGFTTEQKDMSGAGRAQRLQVTEVAADVFPMLGVAPAEGRGFTVEEEKPGEGVAILSDLLWRTQFASDPGMVGRTVELDGKAVTVIGVMPKGFEFPPRGLHNQRPADLWVPLQLTAAQMADVGDDFDYGVLARLRPGATLAQARGQMGLVGPSILRMWASKGAGLPGLRLEVVVDPLRELVVENARLLTELLLGAAGLLLVLSGLNAANLFLVRASGRRREWTLRAALGAGRGRIARQALTEALLVGLLAGAAGTGLAWASLRGLAAVAPATLPQVQGLGINAMVAWFALLLAVAVGPVAGLLGMRAATGLEPPLRESAPWVVGARREARWRARLVVIQVAIAFVLVCGAGLLVRSFQAAMAEGAGVATSGRTVATLSLPPGEYAQPSHIMAWAERLRAKLSAAPGVEGVAMATDQPTNSNWDHVFSVEGRRAAAGSRLPDAQHALVLGPYFRVMGIPLLQGRDFTAGEDEGQANVVIVSRALAARFWPGRSAVGERIKWGPAESHSPWLTVVGVVGDVKDGALDQPLGLYTYSPYRSECRDGAAPGLCRSIFVTVLSSLPVAEAGGQIRNAVAALDASVPVTGVRSLDAVLAASLAPRRFNTMLIGFFGLAALLLAAIGLYGVLAFVVAGQRREIALRIALGAETGQVMRATLGRGLRWSLAGLGVGAAAGAVLSGTVRGLLYATPVLDPLTWVAVGGLLVVVALGACYLPARRASRTAPAAVLREG